LNSRASALLCGSILPQRWGAGPVYHRWDPAQVFVIVTAYGDESGTHDGPDGSPIMMLAGYVATLGQWNRFDVGWRRAIARAGLPGYFHATEHWDTEAGAKFAPCARKLEKKRIRFGYVFELDKASYEQHYIAGNRPLKPQLDTRYSVCFRFLLSLLLTKLPSLFMREDLTLNIVLEKGAKGSTDSLRIVEQLRKQPETRDAAKILGRVTFGQKTKFPGLQISDALSFGSLKIAPTNPGMTDLQQDAPLSAWEKAVQWKPPIYHCRLDETLLGAFKNDILALAEINRRISDEAKKR
jgi:hypothetical protein